MSPPQKRKRSNSLPSSNERAPEITKKSRVNVERQNPEEINALYAEMEDDIKAIDGLVQQYIPNSLAAPPKGSEPKEVLDFYNEDGAINCDKIKGDCIVQYRIRGFGKRYFDLTQIKDLDERIRIIDELKTIHHPTTQKNRRLDSLARLLEGSHTCVAVFHSEHNNTLFITANNIHRRTDAEQYKLITEIMEYFTGSKTYNRIEIFERICLARLKSMDKSGLKISDGTIKRIAQHVLAESDWEQLSVTDLTNIATANNSITDAYEKADILRTFPIIASLARDFKKVEGTFSKNTFEVLSTGANGVHAELRMIDCLLKREEIDLDNISQYIGISRLCCPKCETAIETINFTMKRSNKIARDVIETRGEHGLRSGDKNWKTPNFLDHKQTRRFPKKIQQDIHAIAKNYQMFSTFLARDKDNTYVDENTAIKVCKLLDLIEGKAIKLVKSKYHFENTVTGEKNILAIEEVLQNKQAFLTNTTHNFVILTIQGEQKYLNLKKLRDKKLDFNEVYQDLIFLHHSPGNEEKKQVSQRAAQSSSDEEPEEPTQILENIISRLQRFLLSDGIITRERFVRTIEQECNITLEDFPKNTYSAKDYINIIKNVKKEVRGSKEEIEHNKLIEIIKKNYVIYNAATHSHKEKKTGSTNPYASFDDPREYHEGDIGNYNGWMIRNRLGGLKIVSGNRVCQFLLNNKFTDHNDHNKEYLVAVTDPIDTAGASVPINYFFEKSLQPSNAIAHALAIIIPILGELDQNNDDHLISQLNEHLPGSDEALIKNIFNKLKETHFNAKDLTGIFDVARNQTQQRDVFEELIPEMLTTTNCYAKIIFPYNKTQVHWLSGEIKIAKNNHNYTIEIYAHDPYGGGQMMESNFNTIQATIQKRIREEDPQAVVTCEMKKSSYGRRQDEEDAISCGIITAEDIIKLIRCEDLNIDQPYEKGAFNLREQHCNAFDENQLEVWPIKARFKQRLADARAIRGKQRTLASMIHYPESAESQLSTDKKAKLVDLILSLENQDLKSRIINTITNTTCYKARDGSYLVLILSAIQEMPTLLSSKGIAIDEKDLQAINQIHRMLFLNKCVAENDIYEVGFMLVSDKSEEHILQPPQEKDFPGTTQQSPSLQYSLSQSFFHTDPQKMAASSTENSAASSQSKEQANAEKQIIRLETTVQIQNELISLQGQFYTHFMKVNALLSANEPHISQPQEIKTTYGQLDTTYQKLQELKGKIHQATLQESEVRNFNTNFTLMEQFYNDVKVRMENKQKPSYVNPSASM